MLGLCGAGHAAGVSPGVSPNMSGGMQPGGMIPPPKPAVPGGANGQLQYNNGGLFGGTNGGGDCTWNPSLLIWNCLVKGAPLVNPAGGQHNYAPIDSPVFTTSVTLPAGVSCTGAQVLSGFGASFTPSCVVPAGTGAPLVNPANGQNNYAPINSPSFTGTAVIPTLNLTNSTNTALLFGVVATPNASIVSVASDNMNVAAGAHYQASGGWTADATSASFMSQGAGGSSSFYGNTGLTAGSSFAPTQLVGIDPSGLNLLAGSYQIHNTPAICTAPASTSGGLALTAGSNSFIGVMTGTTATGNVLHIGCNCPTALNGLIVDIQGGGPVVHTARTANSITFNVTNPPDVLTYIVSCN